MSKLLTEMFESDKFRDKIIEARDAYVSTHIETGFSGAKKFMKGELVNNREPFIFSEVGLGAGNMEQGSENAISIPTFGLGKSDGLVDVLFLHYHGKLDDFHPPSNSDLLATNHMKQRILDYDGIKINPIIAVAHYDTKGKSQILAFQEKQGNVKSINDLETIASFYENQAYYDAREVASDMTGFHALRRSAELLEKLDIYNVAVFSCDEFGVPNNLGKKLKNFSSEHEIIPEIFNLTQQERDENFFQSCTEAYYDDHDDVGYMQCPKN